MTDKYMKISVLAALLEIALCLAQSLQYENYGWACDGKYSPVLLPQSGYHGPPEKSSMIFANIVLEMKNATENNEIKLVDVHTMAFTYSLMLIIAWQDSRINFCNHSRMQPMDELNVFWNPDYLTPKIWKPQIDIENQRTVSEQKPSNFCQATIKYLIRK